MEALLGWAGFAAALAAFFLSHSLPLRPANRARATQLLGPLGFSLAYSALSVGVLIWLILAASRAPFVLLWPRMMWNSHAALALMAVACLLLGLSVGRPNPFSFGCPTSGFDATRPGIVRLIRHPVLAALTCWGGAHLLVNGDLAHVILFGLFTGFAAFGGRIIDRRRKRLIGEMAWRQLWQEVQAAPIRLEPVRLLAGLALYALLIALHPLVIGVSPLP
ncbi:NnrU family protein [Pseudoruegeria sp. SHC-113]|uniref:NnrU family protein n=1 Tax=Pseudoruegeria sp. SHC-113 TaxID=2855439 RepID=UPI0021BBB0E2|nr:NnrU family protein [Pseudoruegeria sp. SHC-113]MCT8160167.1 NnrU family protein [Pseudoruegeria sp. SHC-113]